MKKKAVNDYPAQRRSPTVPAAEGPGGDHFDGFIPDPPRHLDRLARKFFESLAQELITAGILRRVDVPVLGEVAQAMSDIDRLTKEIRKEGETYKGPNGGIVYNVKVGLLRDARKRLEAFGDRLGLNPKLRGSMRVPSGERADPTKEELDQMELFIAGKGWNGPDDPSTTEGAG